MAQIAYIGAHFTGQWHSVQWTLEDNLAEAEICHRAHRIYLCNINVLVGAALAAKVRLKPTIVRG